MEQPGPLTLNRQFVQDLLGAQPPCFALGYVGCEGVTTGFLAMRPAQPIPASSSNQGFRFGHSMFGSQRHQVMHFAFEFYGHATFHGLVDPANPIVRAVVDRMLETRDYFFFAVNPDQTAVAFRSYLEEENLAGLKMTRAQFADASCPPQVYPQMVAGFAQQLEPGASVLEWVCRHNWEYLDLDTDPLELGPR